MDSHDDGPPVDGDHDDGLIHLEDMSFDFEDYFVRFRAKELSEQESEEFHARLMGLYCKCVFSGEKPPGWVSDYIANEFCKVLAGGDWNDSFPLPWSPRDKITWGTRAEHDALQIFCDIANLHKQNPEENITTAIQQVASDHSVSYEKARAAWYKHKGALKSF